MTGAWHQCPSHKIAGYWREQDQHTCARCPVFQIAKPDYATCVKISTDASIKEIIPPGFLVMLTPVIVGILFGVETLFRCSCWISCLWCIDSYRCIEHWWSLGLHQ